MVCKSISILIVWQVKEKSEEGNTDSEETTDSTDSDNMANRRKQGDGGG